MTKPTRQQPQKCQMLGFGWVLGCSVLFAEGGVKLAQTQLTDFSNLLVQWPLRLFSVLIKPHQ